MSVRAYYNEIEPYAAEWLRNLITAGMIAHGDVDERSIIDVRPDDLRGYTQCHFFAGIAGWSYALRLAGWPDDREIWTGSCPCQPFSVAGENEGAADPRDLWPAFSALIGECRPAFIAGEQVASAVGYGWLDRVYVDLEREGYACWASIIPACAVGAPHRRDRLWFVADRERGGFQEQPECDGGTEAGERSAFIRMDAVGPGARRGGVVVDTQSVGRGEGRPEPELRRWWPTTAGASLPHGDVEDSAGVGRIEGQPVALDGTGQASGLAERASSDRNIEWISGADGKARRIEPGIRLLANGVPNRVAKLRALGNAIVPQVAAEIIAAYMDCAPWSPDAGVSAVAAE